MTREEYIESEFLECWNCRHFAMYYSHSNHDKSNDFPNCYVCSCYRIKPKGFIEAMSGGIGHIYTDDNKTLKVIDDGFKSFLTDESRWRTCERFVERLMALSNVEQERR